MRRKAKIFTLSALGLLVLIIAGGSAVSANPEDVSIQAPVNPTIRLEVNKNTIDFGGAAMNPEVGNYTDTLDSSIRANVLWRLQVDKNQDLTGTVDTANVIPSSQFTFTSDSSDARVTAKRTEATEFGNAPTMVAEGNRGANMNVAINYALSIGWENEPDTYVANHVYTVVPR